MDNAVADLLDSMLRFLAAGPGLAGWVSAGTFLALVVQVVKHYLLKDMPAMRVNLIVQAVFWAVYGVIAFLGGAEQFRNVVDFLTPILGTLVNVTIGGVASAAIYTAGRELNAPLLGSRSRNPNDS